MTTFEAVPFVEGIVYGEGPRCHDGRLWFTDGPAGKVYSVGETGDLAAQAKPVRPVASGLSLPNGLALLPDEATLVVSETKGSRSLAFPTETDGSLGPPTVFADLGPRRHPDGPASTSKEECGSAATTPGCSELSRVAR